MSALRHARVGEVKRIWVICLSVERQMDCAVRAYRAVTPC